MVPAAPQPCLWVAVPKQLTRNTVWEVAQDVWVWPKCGFLHGLACPYTLAWLGGLFVLLGGTGVVWGAQALGLAGIMARWVAPILRCCLLPYRLHKCRLCFKQLKSISGLVKSKSGLSGRHGSAFRELHLLMASLD